MAQLRPQSHPSSPSLSQAPGDFRCLCLHSGRTTFSSLFSFPSHLELLLARHSPADFQHLHISEGLCFTLCSQADSFSKLCIMQGVGTSTALIEVKMKNPFLGFLWEYTRWCHGCLLRQCVITFLVLPEKLKKATWVLLYHLPPLFSLMLPVTHLDAVLEMPLCSVDVTPITPSCFFSFSFPPQMLLDCLLYIYIMTKRNNLLPSPITRSTNLQSASDIEHFEPYGAALYPVVC